MYWEDKGYLLSKLKYSENSIIANFFTPDHGKFSGIIYGATSKKIKGYLQVGNIFHLNCNIKNEARIPTLKVEIINAITPTFFENQKKLYCISSAVSMIKFLTVENQKRGSTLCRDDKYRPIILMEELPLGEFYDVEIIDSEYGFMTAILV